METPVLDVEVREELGKNKVKRVRAEGLVPCVIYGEKGTPFAIKCDLKAVKKIYKTGKNQVIKLAIKGHPTLTEESVISQAISVNAISQTIIHIDFLKVDLSKEVQTEVPVRLVGLSPGVKLGGILIHNIHKLGIKCLPNQIPSHIDVSIADLQMDKAIKVKDVVVSNGIKVITTPEEIVVHVEAPSGSEDATKEAGAASA